MISHRNAHYKNFVITYFRKNKRKNENISRLIQTGRNEQIRTADPFHPKEVRYQAALRPEDVLIL